MNAELAAFLQQLGTTLGIVLTVITIARRHEIASFFTTHYSKWRQIQALEGENAQLRSSLGAATLANEGFESRISQLSGEVAGLREGQDDLVKSFATLSQKFTVGVAYIASKIDHGDTSMLPELIRVDVDNEIRRQRRAVPPSP